MDVTAAPKEFGGKQSTRNSPGREGNLLFSGKSCFYSAVHWCRMLRMDTAPSPCTYTERVFTGSAARSLVWSGDDLVDWAGGGVRYHADGSVSRAQVNYAYSFDAAVAEPAGEFAVIYTRLGTKGLLLRNGEVLRELNRSFYHASTYEYPVALARRGEQVLLIHCPEEYNKLEIEDAATGERLTARTSTPADFFHSRLAVSPGDRYLLSAGWVWHPWDVVVYYDLEEALRQPGHLNGVEWSAPNSCNVSLAEEASACWFQKGEVLLGGGTEAEDLVEAAEAGEQRLQPCGLALYDLQAKMVRAACVLDEPAGTMMPVGSTHVLAFYQHPRLVRLADGAIEFALPSLSSGGQLSSILHHHTSLPPPLALDPQRCRFALAQGDQVHVVTITLPISPTASSETT